MAEHGGDRPGRRRVEDSRPPASVGDIQMGRVSGRHPFLGRLAIFSSPRIDLSINSPPPLTEFRNWAFECGQVRRRPSVLRFLRSAQRCSGNGNALEESTLLDVRFHTHIYSGRLAACGPHRPAAVLHWLSLSFLSETGSAHSRRIGSPSESSRLAVDLIRRHSHRGRWRLS